MTTLQMENRGADNLMKLQNCSRLFKILCQRKSTRSISSQIECTIKPTFEEDGQLR